MGTVNLERARSLLCALGLHIRNRLLAARAAGPSRLTKVAAVTASDTIYRIDKISEEAIFEWFEEHWPRAWPVEVVMEGIEAEDGTGGSVAFPRGTPLQRTLLKCIIDPIDGTRNLMYDKRPAWALAGIAPQRGRRNRLADICVAAMTELPIGKQGIAEQWSAVKGRGRRGVRGTAIELAGGKRRTVRPRLSPAADCRHGFASIAKFFPEGKELTARIEERLWGELYGGGARGSPLVFDDQYTTTGGQLYEILAGHDRMIADLRPWVHRRLKIGSALVCHPYDICTALILSEAGGIVEDPFGGPVQCPIDTTSPVTWVGYANAKLARSIRPVLRRILKEELGSAVA